jgi:hypothetical protein
MSRTGDKGGDNASKLLNGFVGFGLVVDCINEVALKTGMKQRWHRLLLGVLVDKFPGRRGFNVRLLEKSV